MKALKELRIVFMGTPEFAVASLKQLVEAGCNVVAVVTAPDKPAGRGLQLHESAVKRFAKENYLEILQPVKLKDPKFVDELRAYKADIQVVVAFRMLPEVVWKMPPLGTINVHASLLPQYRGAAPINHAIINGEKKTGVTTFLLQQTIDTGHILLSASIPICDNDNADSIHDKLKELGANLLLDTLKGIAENKITPKPQHLLLNEEIKHAPKIFTEHCEINWQKNGLSIHNLIRGLSPYPTAFTYLNGKKLKIFAGKYGVHPGYEPGKIRTDKKTYLQFDTGDGSYQITELQLEGKKRMGIGDFLRGYHFP